MARQKGGILLRILVVPVAVILFLLTHVARLLSMATKWIYLVFGLAAVFFLLQAAGMWLDGIPDPDQFKEMLLMGGLGVCVTLIPTLSQMLADELAVLNDKLISFISNK